MKEHFIKYIGWYILAIILIIVALVYFLWWVPNHPAVPADGTSCTFHNTDGTIAPGTIKNGKCIKAVVQESTLPNFPH